MVAEAWHTGRSASPGLATGPLFVARPKRRRESVAGSPAEEAAKLHSAITNSIAAIEKLQAKASDDAAEILEFQVAMLGDEALAEGAFAAIVDGAAADAAWTTALDTQIAEYAAAEDEYFRARASDLSDIRDRVLETLQGDGGALPPAGVIYLGEDMQPSRFLACDWSAGGGIALTGGSPSSHVAMLARARGVPMVVGLKLDLGGVKSADAALLDGEGGRINVTPSAEATQAFRGDVARAGAEAARWEKYLLQPAKTADGERVLTQINVAAPEELDSLDPAICDGIGLVRTEFLFHDQPRLPDEANQYAVYHRIVTWAAGRPVTIRTLDAGGDKPIAGLSMAEESNPFLGLRGIRLSLAFPDVFRVQLRALARAAAVGPLKVMLPMVTVPEEIAATAALLDDEVAKLQAAGSPCRRPDLGIMVEVPATALAIERYPAAFFSIGSNDLTQYVTASARDIAAVAGLNDTANPAVLRLIGEVAGYGRKAGIDVSLCGDAGGDPRLLPLLLKAGMRNVSMAPKMLARAKSVIAEWRAS
jgi:phosphotransferase system enzyme I (PtsI)